VFVGAGAVVGVGVIVAGFGELAVEVGVGGTVAALGFDGGVAHLIAVGEQGFDVANDAGGVGVVGFVG